MKCSVDHSRDHSFTHIECVKRKLQVSHRCNVGHQRQVCTSTYSELMSAQSLVCFAAFVGPSHNFVAHVCRHFQFVKAAGRKFSVTFTSVFTGMNKKEVSVSHIHIQFKNIIFIHCFCLASTVD